MTIALMRFLDRYVGKIVIFLLAFWASLTRFFRRHGRLQDPADVRVIAVEKFFGLGSIVNAIPLLERLRKHYPNARIVFVTFSSHKSFFEMVKLADETLYINPANIMTFLFDNLAALWALRRARTDICVDLEFFSKYSMIFSFLTGARVRAGFFSYFNVRSALLTHPTAFNHYKHISRAYLAMYEALSGDRIDGDQHEITLPSFLHPQKERLKELLDGDIEAPFIVVNVNASALCTFRRWPAGHFAQLLGALRDRRPYLRFVFIGSPGEKPYVDRVIGMLSQDNGVINAAGRTDIPLLLALLERADLLISNDSGPVHLAAAYKTRTLVLFGPETPVLYHPLNTNAVVLYKHLYCSPCINVLDNKSFEECNKVACLESISVEEALGALERLNHSPYRGEGSLAR